MVKKYGVIFIFASVFTVLGWLSYHVGSDPYLEMRAREELNAAQSLRRIELIETLDRIVSYQHYYRSVYGHYTKLINRIGFAFPKGLRDSNYDIRVVEASTDHLLVNAFAEVNGKTQDSISIDQDYQIHASFELPAPRPQYLKAIALKHLRLMRNAATGQTIAEEGVFKGYFRYSYSMNSDVNGDRIPVAEGIRFPVKGVQLELGMQDTFEGLDSEFTSKQGSRTGVDQGLVSGPSGSGLSESDPQIGENSNLTSRSQEASLEEEVYLAQQIFYGEMGRYAKTWSELSKIAAFKFEGKDQYWNDSDVTFGAVGLGMEPDVNDHPVNSEGQKSINIVARESQSTQVYPTQVELPQAGLAPSMHAIPTETRSPDRQITSDSSPNGLQIEPILTDEIPEENRVTKGVKFDNDHDRR